MILYFFLVQVENICFRKLHERIFQIFSLSGILNEKTWKVKEFSGNLSLSLFLSFSLLQNLNGNTQHPDRSHKYLKCELKENIQSQREKIRLLILKILFNFYGPFFRSILQS